MTEEEKAVEYSRGLCKDCKSTVCSIRTDKTCAERIFLEQAYLAGLHEGQPKWHDLRKDPNDLPNDDREVICKITTSQLGVYGTVIDSFIKVGSKRMWKTTPNVPKIAWCEIPQFKEDSDGCK